MMHVFCVLVVFALLAAPTPALAVNGLTSVSQQESIESGEEPASIVPAGILPAGEEPPQETVWITQTQYITETVLLTTVVPITETVIVTVIVTEVVPVTVYVTETIDSAAAEKIANEDVFSGDIVKEPTIQGNPTSPATFTSPGATDAVNDAEIAPTAAPASTAPLSATGNAAHKVTHWTQLSPPYSEPTPLPVTGLAMYYAPSVMEGVASYRERANQIEECDECVGRVALLRAGDIGRHVWIQVGDGAVEGSFQVLDVAGRHHIPALLRRNWAVDVDYETAMRWGMRGPIEVTIYAEAPERIAMRPLQNRDAALP